MAEVQIKREEGRHEEPVGLEQANIFWWEVRSAGSAELAQVNISVWVAQCVPPESGWVRMDSMEVAQRDPATALVLVPVPRAVRHRASEEPFEAALAYEEAPSAVRLEAAVPLVNYTRSLAFLSWASSLGLDPSASRTATHNPLSLCRRSSRSLLVLDARLASEGTRVWIALLPPVAVPPPS